MEMLFELWCNCTCNSALKMMGTEAQRSVLGGNMLDLSGGSIPQRSYQRYKCSEPLEVGNSAGKMGVCARSAEQPDQGATSSSWEETIILIDRKVQNELYPNRD